MKCRCLFFYDAGKDLTWYAKGSQAKVDLDQANEDERRYIKDREKDLMAQMLYVAIALCVVHLVQKLHCALAGLMTEQSPILAS